MKIAVIGAGPAGMSAALEAAGKGCKVVLLDKNQQAGRKLRITGGGRGNLTNTNISPRHYYTNHPQLIKAALTDFGFREINDFLQNLGIFLYHTYDGWVYPVSNSAANTADLLAARVQQAGVEFRFNLCIETIQVLGSGFLLKLNDGTKLTFDRVIIATGGLAYPNLGAGGEIFAGIEQLGHKILPVLPALAPVLVDMRQIHTLQGLRLDAGVSLWKDEQKIAETIGNIIFTNWGINGPGVMDISHWIHSFPPNTLKIEVNFVPFQEREFEKFLMSEMDSELPLRVLLGAFSPPKVVQFILRRFGLHDEAKMKNLGSNTIEKVILNLRQLRVAVNGVKGFDQCQVSTGGVPLDEIHPLSMQSRLVEGLFFAGEILDVIGPCGGYNLHWAFSSGIRAGRSCGIF